jgi:hypothetical protein
MEKRKTILLIAISITAILIIGVFLALWNPNLPPVITMPISNGYNAFMQAGVQVAQPSSDFARMNEVELHYLVEANSNALQTARSGLAEKSRVPLQFSQQYLLKHGVEMQQIRLLGQAFAAEGRLTEMEHRTNDAARAYLDTVRLGISSRQGGTLIDTMIGNVVEALGTTRLQHIVSGLDARASTEIANELEASEADAESWEQVLEDENNWSRQAFPGFQYRLVVLLNRNQIRANQVKAKQTFMEHQSNTHRLMLDLAAHAYELDKGHRPASAADLIPAYLKAVPIDPTTGKEMRLIP